MFSGLSWYGWLAIVAALATAVYCKARFLKRWSGRRRERKDDPHGKWGDET